MSNSGWTTTSALADSLDDIRSSARITREYDIIIKTKHERKKGPEKNETI